MAQASFLPACQLPGIQAWRSERVVDEIDGTRVMILHGTADQLIPIDEGRRLQSEFDAAGHGVAEWIEIPGAGHSNLMDFPVYLDEIDRFIAELTDGS